MQRVSTEITSAPESCSWHVHYDTQSLCNPKGWLLVIVQPLRFRACRVPSAKLDRVPWFLGDLCLQAWSCKPWINADNHFPLWSSNVIHSCIFHTRILSNICLVSSIFSKKASPGKGAGQGLQSDTGTDCISNLLSGVQPNLVVDMSQKLRVPVASTSIHILDWKALFCWSGQPE